MKLFIQKYTKNYINVYSFIEYSIFVVLKLNCSMLPSHIGKRIYDFDGIADCL